MINNRYPLTINIDQRFNELIIKMIVLNKISSIHYHVFIRILKKDQHFWSPQLYLEIFDIEVFYITFNESYNALKPSQFFKVAKHF